MQDMERKHKELEEPFETMKRGIIETANKKTDSYDIGVLRKNMILRF